MAQELGGLVAEFRQDLPLREQEAAYRAWITPAYWHAIERGKRLPSVAVFIMLARSLGLDPRELLDALLERMRYGRGAPPVFQKPLRQYSDSKGEVGRLAAVRGTHNQGWAGARPVASESAVPRD